MKKISLAIVALACFQLGLLAQVSLDGNRLKPSGMIRFQTGSNQLVESSTSALQELADYLKAKPYITQVRIEGHVSAGDREQQAQVLSEQRAVAVANWLIQAGIDCTRLLPVGFGGNKPMVSNQTPEGRAENSRIELHVAALRGKLLGGMPADGGGRAQSVCN